MYEVHWSHDGKPGYKEFPTLYALAEWIQNLHWWGVKAESLNVQWVERGVRQ